MEVSLEGNCLVKSTRYLIVISFQGEVFRLSRPIFNFMILYGLDTLQLTYEKEKSSVAQCSTGLFQKKFLECIQLTDFILGETKRLNLHFNAK